MSIASPRSAIHPPSPPRPGDVSLDSADPKIQGRIEETRRKIRWATLSIGGLWTAISLLSAIIIWVLLDHTLSIGSASRWSAWFGLIAGGVTIVITWLIPTLKSGVAIEYASRCIERRYPQLRQSLTTYVTLCSRTKTESLGGRVVRTEGRRLVQFLAKNDTPVAEALVPMQLWLAAIGMLFAFGIYAAVSSKSVLPSIARLTMPWASIDAPKRVLIQKVKPGESTVLAGRDVVFSVEVSNLHDDESVRIELVHPMLGSFSLSQSPDEGRDNEFTGTLAIPSSASGSATYRVIAGDALSKTYQLDIENLPSVSIERIRYQRPKYTGDLEPIIRQDGNVSAMEGTRVTIHARANRPIKSAKLEFNPIDDGGRVRITAGSIPMSIADDQVTLSGSFRLRSAGSDGAVRRTAYRVRIADFEDVLNPDPIIYSIEALPDLQPEITISMPSGGYREVPITAQQIIELHATDPDFGLSGVAIELTRATEPKRAIIWQAKPEDKVEKTRIFEYRFRPQALGLGVGQELTFRAIARDNRFDPGESLTWDEKIPGVTASRNLRLKIVDLSKKPDKTPEPGDIDPADDGLSEVDQEPAVQEKDESSEENATERTEGGKGQDAAQEQESSQDSEGSESSEKSESSEGSQDPRGDDDSQSERDSDDQTKGSQETGSQPEAGTDESDEDGKNPESNPNEQGSGDNGESNSPSSQSNPGQTPEPDGSSESNEMGEGENGQQVGSTSEQSNSDQKGDSPSGGGSSASDSSEQSQGTPGNADGEPSQSDAVEPSGRRSSDTENSNGTASDSDPTGNNSSSGEQGSSGNQTPSTAGNQQSNQPSGSQGGAPPSDGNSPNKPSTPASNDGEAFERMADYLKNQSQSGGSQKPKSNDKQGGNDQSSSSNSTKDGKPNRPSQPQDSSSNGAGQEPAEDASMNKDANPSGASSTGSPQNTSEETSQAAGSARPSKDSAAPSQRSNASEQDPQDGSSGGQQGPQEQKANGKGNQRPKDSNSNGKGSRGSSQQGSDEKPTQDGLNPNSTNDQGLPSGSNKPSQKGDGVSAAGGRAPGATNGQGSSENSNPNGSGQKGSTSKPLDEANMEYAREATDMVLDYLDRTRETPDPDLLEELQWDEDQLRRFQERWQSMREDSKLPETSKSFEEALRSLGMRDPKLPQAPVIGPSEGDSLKGLRDDGGRRRVPAAYRDAFEAFQRSLVQ